MSGSSGGGGYGGFGGGYGQSTMPRFGNTQGGYGQGGYGYRPGFQGQPQSFAGRNMAYGGGYQPPQFGQQFGMSSLGGVSGNSFNPGQLEGGPMNGGGEFSMGGPSGVEMGPYSKPMTVSPMPAPQTGGLMPQQPAGSGPGPANNAAQRRNMLMSEWGGSGNIFDSNIMAQNGWGFDPTTGAWNGAIPDEYKNVYRGDGFTGIRPGSGVFSINGQDAVGGQYLGGTLDPRQAGWLDAMGGGGTIRDMLGTQGFIGRGSGGGGGLMNAGFGTPAPKPAPAGNPATRPAQATGTPTTHNPWASSTPNPVASNTRGIPTGNPGLPARGALPLYTGQRDGFGNPILNIPGLYGRR